METVILFLWLMGAVLAAPALAGCSKPVPVSQGVPGAASSAEQENFKIEVSISHLPKLDEPFTVTATFTAIGQDEADAELWLNVTDGVYLDGEDRWHGPLNVGESKTLSATFAILIEGNQAISAAAYTTDGIGQASEPPIRVHISSEESEFGWKQDNSRGVHIASQGEVAAGRNTVVDTALLLNTAPTPRIEFIDSYEDIATLQAEGLFPSELRYGWRDIRKIDFSEAFLIAYFDAMRPTPGYLAKFVGERFIWENGILRGGFEIHDLPPDVGRPIKPISPVVIRVLSWKIKPVGLDVFAFQGVRNFEIVTEGGVPIMKVVELQPGPAHTPTPVPSLVPPPPHNLVRLLPHNIDVAPGETFDMEVQIDLQGQQEVSAAQVGLTFDPAYLEVKSVALLPDSPLKGLTVPPQIDNEGGTVFFAAAVNPSDPKPTTTFTLAVLTLQVKAIEVGDDEVETTLRSIGWEDPRSILENPRATKVDAVSERFGNLVRTLGVNNPIITIGKP